MNACPGNETLTHFIHSVTRGGGQCVQLIREGDKYLLRRIRVPDWVDPAYGLPTVDPRNVRVVEELLALSLADAAEAIKIWEQTHGSMPTVAFQQGSEGCAWVLLTQELSPVQNGAKSERFACII